MKCYNVGGMDRVARGIIGLGIIGAGLYFQSWFGLLGILPIFTAVAGFCPGYLPFRASTCKAAAKQA